MKDLIELKNRISESQIIEPFKSEILKFVDEMVSKGYTLPNPENRSEFEKLRRLLGLAEKAASIVEDGAGEVQKNIEQFLAGFEESYAVLQSKIVEEQAKQVAFHAGIVDTMKEFKSD
jgi:hypothetical protein